MFSYSWLNVVNWLSLSKLLVYYNGVLGLVIECIKDRVLNTYILFTVTDSVWNSVVYNCNTLSPNTYVYTNIDFIS